MYELAVTFWGSVAGLGLIVAAVGGTIDAVARAARRTRSTIPAVSPWFAFTDEPALSSRRLA